MSLAKDVARRAGVSTATVSRVLNGSGYVSPALQARVAQAVQELDYEANALARSLRRGRSGLLGLLVADVASPFFAAVTKAIEEDVARAGYSLLLCATGDDPARERQHLAMLRHLRADGLIASPCGENDEQIMALAERGIPIVLLDRRLRRTRAVLDVVQADAAGGTAQAVDHLIDCGHQQIGLLPGPLQLSSARDRLAGYWRAMTRRGLPYDDALVEECPYTMEGGRAKALRLLHLHPRPTALLAGSELIMLGALQAAREIGLRVPQDVAVAGFAESEWPSFVEPPLTAIVRPAREMGLTAARLLRERLELDGQSTPAPREILLPTRLVVRQSSAAAAALAGDEAAEGRSWPTAASE